MGEKKKFVQKNKLHEAGRNYLGRCYSQFYSISVTIACIDEVTLMFPNLYIKHILQECTQLTSEELLWVV